jgi:hypothetical protein
MEQGDREIGRFGFRIERVVNVLTLGMASGGSRANTQKSPDLPISLFHPQPETCDAKAKNSVPSFSVSERPSQPAARTAFRASRVDP